MPMHFVRSRLVRFSPDEGAVVTPAVPAPKVDVEDPNLQTEEDKKYAERARRAAESRQKEILEALGVKDTEEAKKLIENARKADEANKSELEKAESAKAQAEEKAAQALRDAQALVDAANKKLMDSEIRVNAGQAFKDKDGKTIRPAFRKDALDDVLLVINREGIADKDGKFEGVDKALEKLAKEKPWLLEAESTAPKKGGPVERKNRERASEETEKRTPIVRSL